MLGGVLPFAVAFATSCSLIVPIRRMALHWGMVDVPNARKIHRTPIPLMGGVAIYCGTVLAIMGFVESRARGQIFGILAASTLLLAVGILDDRHLLHHQIKLFVAMPLAALTLVVLGIKTQASGPRSSPAPSALASTSGSPFSGWWELPLPTIYSTTWTASPAA